MNGNDVQSGESRRLTKLLFRTAPPWCDAISEVILAAGAESVSFTPPPHNPAQSIEITALFPHLTPVELCQVLTQIDKECIIDLGVDRFDRTIDSILWEPNKLDWRASFPPLEVGKGWLVAPEWWQGTSGRTVIRILPGTGFGTGKHESTRLALILLEEESWQCDFLDVGTGSGILAIAACFHGATTGLALDIDPVAIDNCTHNLKLNNVADRVGTLVGSPSSVTSTFPLILANLEEHIFRREGGDIVARLRPGGRLLVSGVTDEGWVTVKPLFENMGLVLQKQVKESEWIAALFSNS